MTERKIKVLLAKPGLDGHDVGAKVVVLPQTTIARASNARRAQLPVRPVAQTNDGSDAYAQAPQDAGQPLPLR